MLSKSAKNEIIEQFSEVFKANPSVLLVEYKGLSVKEIEGLRSNLKGADTKLTVVKNTLLRKAAKDTDVEQLNDLFIGPTAIAVCESDPTAAAKVFVDTAKDLPALVIKGGVVEGSVVGAEEITALSKLPSRQEMMAQLLGALTSPMSNLLGSLTQLQSKLLYALEAVKDTKTDAPEAKEEEPKVEAKEEEAKEESPKEDKPEEKAEAKEEAPEEAKAESEEPSEPEAKAEAEEGSNEEVKEEAAQEAEPETNEAGGEEVEAASEEAPAEAQEGAEEEGNQESTEEEKEES